MKLLVLGQGKTGSAVAQAAQERGHSVQVLRAAENQGGNGLTASLLATADVVLDFTTPSAVLDNLRVLLRAGTKVVVGTTGWYEALPEMTALAERHHASLLHGTNFSLGVQAFLRVARELARSLPEYEMAIEEIHHLTKKDAPSGTALTLQTVVEQASGGVAPIVSHRAGDAAGLHVLTLRSPAETLTIQQESCSRRAFGEGAVRAAEWLASNGTAGVFNFTETVELLFR